MAAVAAGRPGTARYRTPRHEHATVLGALREGDARSRAVGPGQAADPGHRGRHPGHAAGPGLGRHRAGPPITAHDQAGWYRHSPTPGQTGPSVILGHVTVGAYGDGVFRHLAGLHRGDRIVARLENGTEAVFGVTSLRTVAKADFPTDDVYGDVGRPELRLVTCGGTLTDDGYPDNVIVFAALNEAAP